MLCALALSGCQEEPAIKEYEASLKIYGDPGRPLAGAEVTHGADRVGASDADGQVSMQLRGTEGQILVVVVHCPKGYRSPAQATSILLRRVSEQDRSPEYQARCEPLLRTVVVAVRADKGPSLPVLYLGQEVARTDSAGAAHFMLKSPPEDSLELILDTSQNPGLRPQNPSARFQIAGQDELLVFSQKFELPPPKPPKIRRLPRIIRLGAR
jgi:hypothetical protein